MSNTGITGFPNTGAAFVNPQTGLISEVWRRFLLYLWTNTEQVGDVRLLAGNTIPQYWLLCNGQAVSRITYANLFQEIGTIWGTGDGISTFNIPQLQGLAPLSLHGNYIIRY